GQVCPAAAPMRTFASDCPARRTTAAAPSPNNAEEITSAFEPRSMRQANVHSSITTTRTIRLSTREPRAERQTRDAACTAPSEDGDAHDRWPKSHFRRHPRFNARSRDTCGRYRHDNIDVAPGPSPTFETSPRRLHKQFVCPLKIDLGALCQVVRRA